MKINNTDELVPMGTFMITKPDNEDVVKKSEYVGYDYMIKFDIPFEEHNTYPISLYGFLTNLCTKVGIELGTRQEDLINGTYSILGNPFTNNESCRFVLGQLAQLAGGFAHIGRDNKLYIKALGRTPVDTIDKNNYNDSFTKSNTFGAINSLKIDLSAINGEETTRDAEGISPEDRVQLTISDNYFLIDSEQREMVIDAIFNSINGIIYTPIKTTYYGYPYADVGDLILMRDTENTAHNVYLFGHKFVSNGAYSGEIECIALTKTESAYPVATNKIQSIYKNTEFKVDKINGTMEGVISTQTEQNQKIARVVQTVDELNSKISDIADVTTSLETNTARLEFEKINESEPVRVVIRPVGVNISYLYPSPVLQPSNNLYFKVRILRFENTTEETIVDYILPDDLLYYDADNYDEFILDYDAHTCIVNKKCKWNSDGTVGLLDAPRTDEYEYPTIPLTNGDYTVSLVNYNNAYLFARLMVQNIYTTQFATRAEVGSQISQTTQDINLSVDTKLSNYSTTTQMNSAIDLKANQITSSVSENYATKETLNNNYSTTEQTANMISTTVSQAIKNNLEEVTVEYALGTSTTTAPTSGWSTTAPTWQQGKYMWQRTKTKTADGTESTSNPTCIAGAKGQDGTNGVSISSIAEYYAVSTSNSTAPADSAFKTTMQTMTATNKYLWNYEVINFSNGTTQNTNKRVIGTYGDKGQAGTDGTNGVGISSIVNKYAVSSSNTTAPSSWSNTPQTMTATNKYLWNYEIITYSNNTTYTSTPAVIGTYGDKGNTGDTGKGVKAVVAQYYLSSSKTSQTGGSWSETQPTYKKDYYYWTRTKITWTDDTTTYTTPILVEEINSLNENVAKLEITAGNISTEVSKKVGNNEVISKINQSAEAVTINANKLNINGAVSANGNFKVDTSGNLIATSATLTNAKIVSNANNSSITMQNGSIITKDNDGNTGIKIVGQDIEVYSYNSSNNYVGTLGSVTYSDYQCIALYADKGDGVVLGAKNRSNQIESYIELNRNNSGLIDIYKDIRMAVGCFIKFVMPNGTSKSISTTNDGHIKIEKLYAEEPEFGLYVNANHYSGRPVICNQSDHVIFINWQSNTLNFYVDATYVGNLSDRRLKKDITEIDDNLVKAIAECHIYQFKAENRNGLMSVGIMAQDFQNNCKKYGIKAEDYEVFKKIKYNLDDDTEYYSIDYEQYLIIKNKYLEDKVKEQEDRLNRLEEKINGLYKNNVE